MRRVFDVRDHWRAGLRITDGWRPVCRHTTVAVLVLDTSGLAA